MKKTFALLIVMSLLFAALSSMHVSAGEESFEFAHFVATGNDPYASFTFNPGGNNTTIDPDTVKWASVKYRTITETDNTGVQLIGQLYISPAAEPFIPIKYVHSGQWETLIVDLTSVSDKTSLASKWNSASYTDKTSIRFDPLESNRDAELAQSESDTAVVSDGDSIDIAWIAFFESEEDAKAYDGTQNTPYCILLPEDFEWPSGGNNLPDPEVFKVKPAATEAPEAPTEAPEVPTEAPTEAPAENVTDKETEQPSNETIEPTIGAITETPDNGTEKAPESTAPEKSAAKEDFPFYAVIIIAAAGIVLICVIVMTIVSAKKKKK